MAETDFAALTTQQKKVWSAITLQAGRDASFWMSTPGFMSSGLKDATKPIHYVDELTETERGAKCVLPLVQDLVGDGVVGDNRLEGNEEPIVVDDIEIRLDQHRNGAKSKGRMSEQKTVIRFRQTARDKLAFWQSARTDEMIFLVASGVAFTKNLDGSTRALTSQLPSLAFAADVTAPSTNRIIYGGTATATNNLTTTDKMSYNLLVRAKTKAQRARLKPVRIKGKDTYIVVMSTEQARDLHLDNDYRTAVAHASNRGPGNELFTGAFANVVGLILFEHNRICTTLGLGSGSKYGAAGTVDGAQALLLGAQAVGYARIGDPQWHESDNTDYANQQGVSYSYMVGLIKAKFKSIYDGNASEDFSVVTIYTAAAAT